MKDPIILEGPSINWGYHQEQLGKISNPDGSLNFGAAMGADPGVMSCPECKAYMWQGGHKVKCPDCGEEFETPWYKELKSRVEVDCTFCEAWAEGKREGPCPACDGTKRVMISKSVYELRQKQKEGR